MTGGLVKTIGKPIILSDSFSLFFCCHGYSLSYYPNPDIVAFPGKNLSSNKSENNPTKNESLQNNNL